MPGINEFDPGGDEFNPPASGAAAAQGGDGSTGPGVGGGLSPFDAGGDPFAPQAQSVPQGAPPAFTYYTLGTPTVSLAVPAGVLIAGSAQDLFIPVALTDATSGNALDPTALPVQIAFTTGGDPVDTDWAAAGWLTPAGGTVCYAAFALAAMAPASYSVFLQIGGFIGQAPGLLRVR